MGSTNSRHVSRPSSRRVNHTKRFSLSSLLPCGASTSRATYEIEDHPTELLVDSATDFNDQVQKVTEESSLSHSTEAGISRSHAQTGTSFGSSIQSCENANLQDSSRSVATSNQRECLFKRKELVPPYEVSTDHSYNESYRDSSDTASPSFVEQKSSDPVSVNSSANKDAVNNIDNLEDSSIRPISHETLHLRSSSPQVFEDSGSHEHYVESHSSAAIASQNSDSSPSSQGADLPVTSLLQENESHEETIPPSLGFLVPDRERGHVNEGVLHVDVVTISSNTLSYSNTDAIDRSTRRNGRRPFWDAFSNRSSRRFRISPTIVFSAGDPDDIASQDQWFLDLSSGFSNDEVGEDFEYLGSRIRRSNARMLHSRSQIWERLRDGLNETDRWTNSCPLGLHPDGRCFCEPFSMTEESNTRASMSRIVMLAEALFEFLDEVHRQPTPFSLSVASLPAPESVVDAFPLKCHKTVGTADGVSNTEQCHICLVEYEEGDKIRVLPCNHEFHMACVDKWLKEIHGICPLCRGNVCGGGFTGSSASNTEVA
ncbi:uncharacterized RING finger protein C4G3.12c [Neltuma alba]|uniref:uncharacterized RING finger protein C4G3.12c n=1 Tax=Neltuma alba TaxID=207710 RepID=UPI0010A45C13|nr:uncharacterized RING finger protein C4G3.12c-like [Prosopis alba]